VARILKDALIGLQIKGPVMERWNKVLELAKRDAFEIR
jgi:hypothetical protein